MKHLIILSAFFGCFVLKTNGQIMYGEARVVFEANKKINLTLKRDTSYERFTPTSEEIDKADEIVQTYFVANHKTKIKQIQSYYRQYVGLKTEKERFIFIKAACVQPDNFSKNTFIIFGGGDCYFETDVNLTDRKVSYIYFHAPL